jgi:hypothetical protein
MLALSPAVAPAWALVAHAVQVGAAAANTVTPAINTTGADLFVLLWTTYNAGSVVGTISDSQGNSWTIIDSFGPGNWTSLAYVHNPTTSAAHTFTLSGVNSCPIEVQAWSGSVVAGTSLDQHSAIGSSGGNFLTATPITPSQPNCLIISGAGFACNVTPSTGPPTPNQSFVLGDSNTYTSNVSYGGAIASLQQTVAAPVNPTWTAHGSDNYTGSVINIMLAAFLRR